MRCLLLVLKLGLGIGGSRRLYSTTNSISIKPGLQSRFAINSAVLRSEFSVFDRAVREKSVLFAISSIEVNDNAVRR